MLIIFRWWYFLGLGGLGLVAVGVVETNLALESGSEPLSVSLDDLQSGQPVVKPYVRLGEHVALYPYAAYVEKGASKRVDTVLVPIVDPGHVILHELQEAARSKDPQPPELRRVHVFLQTKGDAALQAEPRKVAQLEGIVRRYDKVSSDVRNLVRTIDPQIDTTKVRVIEAGRRPKALAVTIGMVVAGVALLVLAVRKFRGPRPPAAAGQRDKDTLGPLPSATLPPMRDR